MVALAHANRAIGAGDNTCWQLPEHVRHFKNLTLGHPVIMERRMWELLKDRLSQRENIVVTRTPGYEAPGAAVATSLQAALALCAGEPVAFVIGCRRLFEEALPLADGLVLTEIQRDFEGDTFFPAWDRSQWRESQREPHTAADGTKFDFVLYERKAA